MLGLQLRSEFEGKRLKGTQIDLVEASKLPAEQFLAITYPSTDLLKTLAALAPGEGRPVVLMGERGKGKSHLMAALYHAIKTPDAIATWLNYWAAQLGSPYIAGLRPRTDTQVISVNLNRQRYKYLWDLILEEHPEGNYIRGKWEGMGDKKTDILPHDLVIELLQKQPIVLILDEFQTWYDALTNSKRLPARTWAFSFIQMLSEIAQEYPDLLSLVVSVRNGGTDAYLQIHRVNPVLIDFEGPNAASERRKLLLHRLFENRMQVAESAIESLTQAHVAEYFRLRAVPPTEQERKQQEFIEAWPFAPHLLQLLEDQILVATEAQDTRDLIKILADLFKRHSDRPLITAADFRVDDEVSGVASLLDSVVGQRHLSLRDKAQRNLVAVREAVKRPDAEVPHLSEVMGALWVRSLSVSRLTGADPATLQLDITRDRAIDENAFQVELETIAENSFNIHRLGDRLVFQVEDNPQTKLMAFARNDRLFEDGSDQLHLRNEIRYALAGSGDLRGDFRVIVLPTQWLSNPWGELDPAEHPDQWDARLPILVIPEEVAKLNERLGPWLKEHVPKRRNTIRFLLPKVGSSNAYYDRDLIVLARAVLKAKEWQGQSPEYKGFEKKYHRQLQEALQDRFDRFAILQTWNYGEPNRCQFVVEGLQAKGSKIPDAIEERLRRDIFIPEDFEEQVLEATTNGDSVSKLLSELQEPRTNGRDCIPWLGEVQVKEKLIRLCAQGKLAINLQGRETIQAKPGEEESAAYHRMKAKLPSGRHLEETYLQLPQAAPTSDGSSSGSSAPPASTGSSSTSIVSPDSGGSPPTIPTGDTPYPPPTTPPPPIPHEPDPGTGVGTTGGSMGGSIFDSTPPAQVSRRFTPATSALNLYAKATDEWGINPGSQVKNLTLSVESLTGAQLQKLLKNLPDGLTYGLELDKEEG
ncbi:MAG: DUF499 domain-containing protein [Spirulina sp.]